MPKNQRRTVDNIWEPTAVYVVTPDGIARPAGSTDADAWRDLLDVGRRLSLPPEPGEARQAYALRLRAALSRLDPNAYLDGAAIYALRQIVNLDCSRRRRASDDSTV